MAAAYALVSIVVALVAAVLLAPLGLMAAIVSAIVLSTISAATIASLAAWRVQDMRPATSQASAAIPKGVVWC